MATSTQDARSESGLKRGALGTPGIVFLVLAAVTPIGAVAGPISLGLVLGNGAGFPGTLLFAGIILLLFAVGYAAMSHHVTNAGAFYTYVTKGLGRPAGAAAAFVALVAYTAVFCSVAGALGFFAHIVFDSELGIDLPWELWAAIAMALVALMGRRRIDLNAAVLGTALVVEVLIILAIDVAIVADKGLGVFSFDSFNPDTVFAGSAGAALVFAFNAFVGFEATALFAEEARDAKRTIPRATYVAVSIIALFYALTAWCLVSAYGGGQVQAVAGDPDAGGPGTFLFRVNAEFVGGFTDHAIQWLVVTSLFAALLATHNATARYFFALGREGLLPASLGRTHPTLKSPHVAGAVQIALSAVIVAAYAIGGSDPLLELAASLVGLGTVGLVLLEAAVAFAVVGFFRRRGDKRLFTTVIAPVLGGVGLLVGAYLIVRNYEFLTGKESGVVNQLPWLLLIAAIAGAAYALWLRGARSAVYDAMGREPADAAAAA